MRLFFIPTLLATGALVAGTATSPARAQDEAMAACRAGAEAFMAAVASGDPAKVAARFTADGVLTTPEGIFEGQQAILGFEKAALKPGSTDVDTFKTARMLGDAVLCHGGYTFTLAPGGPVKEFSGTWTKLLSRSGNDWRLEALTYTYSPPPTTPQPQQQSQAR